MSICISKYLLGIGEAKICSVALEERLGSGHLERKKLSLMLSYFNRYARETIFFFPQEASSELDCKEKQIGSRIKLHLAIMLLQKHFQHILG